MGHCGLVLLMKVTYYLQEEDSADYCLVEVSQMTGVTEKVVADNDTPWKKCQDLRRVSPPSSQ